MPRGDRTGPAGQGPKTGRGAGLCSGNSAPGFMNGFFRGRFNRGRGWNFRYIQSRANDRSNNSDNMLGILRSLREQLDTIEQKLKRIK